MDSPIPVTMAQLTAFIAVHIALPMMEEKPLSPAPVQGWVAEDDLRAKMNLPVGGSTVIYKIDDRQILMDISGATILLMYVGADAAQGLEMLEGAFALQYPAFKFQEDIAHPHGGKRRVRGHVAKVSEERTIKAEIEYPEPGAADENSRFIVRMTAFEPEPINLLLPRIDLLTQPKTNSEF